MTISPYIEWVHKDNIGFITNCFGRVLYINGEWPDGDYTKYTGNNNKITKTIKERCRVERKLTKEDLVLELI